MEVYGEEIVGNKWLNYISRNKYCCVYNEYIERSDNIFGKQNYILNKKWNISYLIYNFARSNIYGEEYSSTIYL